MEYTTAHKAGDEVKSSSGGTIKFTKNGLIHTAGKTYGGEDCEAPKPTSLPPVDEEGNVIKRGRGRPLGSKNRTTKW